MKKFEEMVCAAEPWPVYDKWWLGIYSKPHPEHKGFDVIEVTAEGPEDWKKVVASIMVPEIDGMVCESHSFISSLIHQNKKAALDEALKLIDLAEVRLTSGLDYMKQGKRQFAPNTTNSDVDVWIDDVSKALDKIKAFKESIDE